MSKICVVYHSIDIDGWMSAAIVKHWFILNNKGFSYTINGTKIDRGKNPWKNNSITFIGYNYGQPIPDLSEYDKVIMCDISFPKEEMNSLEFQLEYGNPDNDYFIWIDHHISAIKDNDNRSYHGLRDTKFAACELTWKYFFPNEPMPEIVRLLGLYDSFRHKGTDEEQKVLEFQYGARQCISNYEEAYAHLVDEGMNYKNPEINTLNIILEKGKSIYQYLCTEAKQTYKNGFKLSIGKSPHKIVDIATLPDLEPETLKNAAGTFLPYIFICINKERFNPINFGIDYHKDGYDGVACFYYNGKDWCFSLYNDNGLVDCSQIAKQYGGGGHFSASGFRCDNNTFLQIISK